MNWFKTAALLAASIATSPSSCSVSAFVLPSSTSSSVAFAPPTAGRAYKGTMSSSMSPSYLSSSTTTSTDFDTDTMTTSKELIPREVLFGNPENTGPNLSPDGKYLSYLAPSPKGVMNAFVKDLSAGDDSEARMMTDDTERNIRSLSWCHDSSTILFMQDAAGDENFHLFAVDVGEAWDSEEEGVPPARDLTPGEGVKAQNVITNYRYADELLVGTNARNSSMFDMYRVNYKTGEMVLDTQNPGDIIGWGTEDESFQVRQATARNSADSSTTVRVRDDPDSEWRDVFHFPYGEEGGLVEFCADGGKTGYLTSSIGRETTALLKVDLTTGDTIENIYSNDKCNVGGVTFDKDTKEIRALTYNYARTERKFYDAKLEKDYDFLVSTGPDGAEVGVSSRTLDESKWIVNYRQSDGPTSFVVYDKVAQTVTPLFVSMPKLLDYDLAPMEDVRIEARDGLELVAYLTRARKEGTKCPLVLLVHGGPWARDYWGFSPAVQWFANRGYSTLQVNFRGSTGYGKSFLHKGDKQWGVGDMQHDLTDAVQWAIDDGIADEENICIYGGSYGGYACLAGLAFTPDLYKCGVDIVGPSNIKTLLDSIPSYWGPLRNGMLLKIGDVDSDEEFNRKISPLYHVDNIKVPLLIGQGANDPRVKQAEADQIAFSMDAKGIPVEYVLYPDEGHGFVRPENRIDFNGRVEQFLATHLGGRAEDFAKVEGSTAQFPLLERTEAKAE